MRLQSLIYVGNSCPHKQERKVNFTSDLRPDLIPPCVDTNYQGQTWCQQKERPQRAQSKKPEKENNYKKVHFTLKHYLCGGLSDQNLVMTSLMHLSYWMNVWGNLCFTGVSGPSVFPVRIWETACAAWAVMISDSFTAAWLITAMYVQHYLTKRWAGAETRLNPADLSVWNKTANAVWCLDQTTKPHDLSKALQPRAVEMFWDGGDTLFLNGLDSGWNMIFKWQDLTKA